MKRTPTLIVALSAGALASCADEPTAVGSATSNERASAIAASDERLDVIQSLLQFTREQSRRVVDRDDARTQLERALAALSVRLDARDRRGVERALGQAREALDRYRATVPEDSGLLPDLDAIALMLDGVEAAAADDVAMPESRED